MSFIAWLEQRAATDTKVRAVLKRSLAFEPGTHVPSFPYVEPFLKDNEWLWRQQVHYLVAGLWALNWEAGQRPIIPLGRAAARRMLKTGSASTERRFLTLLDADPDQLANRLLQMVRLLKGQALDFEGLLAALLRWDAPSRNPQHDLARDFYRTLQTEGHALSDPDGAAQATTDVTTPTPEETH